MTNLQDSDFFAAFNSKEFDISLSILQAFFAEKTLVSHQLDGYNSFITSISDIIATSCRSFPIKLRHKINDKFEEVIYTMELSNPVFLSPRYSSFIMGNNTDSLLYPKMCREENMSYMAELKVDIRVYNNKNNIEKIFSKVSLGKIHTMYKSMLCNLYPHRNNPNVLRDLGEDPNDPGGYFIIGSKKGVYSEKVIVSQERNCYNKWLYTIDKKTGLPTMNIKSWNTGNNQKLSILINKSNDISIMFKVISETPFPLIVLIRILGGKINDFPDFFLDLDENVLDIVLKNLTHPTVTDELSPSDCIAYVAERTKLNYPESATDSFNYVEYATRSLFPHLNSDKDSTELTLRKKRLYLILILREFLEGRLKYDRDHLMNKRAVTVEELFNIAFISLMKKMFGDIQKACEKKPSCANSGIINPQDYIKINILQDYFQSSLSNGDWGTHNKTLYPQASQALEIVNNQSYLSNIRKCNNNIQESGMIEGPRRVHSSQYGYFCPSDTPESKSCGLVKTLSISCFISSELEDDVVVSFLTNVLGEDLITDIPETLSSILETKIYIKKSLIGIVQYNEGVYERITRVKKAFPTISITRRRKDDKVTEINIWNDRGRWLRPLFKVEEGKLLITPEIISKLVKKEMGWKELVYTGCIEILDPEEVDCPDTFISMYASEITEEHTHCEIHPAFMYGIIASLTPFPHHSQSPRVCYQCSMGKHAYGTVSENYLYKFPGTQIVLNYPQKPLVSSKFADFIGYNEMPSGTNAIVAIKNGEYNQEDSLIICKKSLDLGMFDTSYYKDHHTQVKKTKGEELEIPNGTGYMKIGRVTEILNSNPDDIMDRENKKVYIRINKITVASNRSDRVPYGVAKIGSVVYKGDVVIGKLSMSPDGSITNNSIVFTDYDVGRICKVRYGHGLDGVFTIHVKVVELRLEEIGNKFSSRIGQKGTCGRITAVEDMPFSPDPYSAPNPDIVMNPQAFPSRMTIGHLIECLLSKKVCSTDVRKARVLNSHTFYTNMSKPSLPIPVPNQVTNPLKFLRNTSEPTDVFEITPHYDVPLKVIHNLYEKHGITKQYGESKGDATPFEKVRDKKVQELFGPNSTPELVDVIREELRRLGYAPHGHQRLYCGETGEEFKALIFMGPTYYQKLEQVVANKMHARSTGPKQSLNRQPLEGKKKNGGHKIGEMENACLVANGATHNVRERLMEVSDQYSVYVCKVCGIFSDHVSKLTTNTECKMCKVKGPEYIKLVTMPYAFKLITQELESSLVSMRLNL